jgi:hypothetical protein
MDLVNLDSWNSPHFEDRIWRQVPRDTHEKSLKQE